MSNLKLPNLSFRALSAALTPGQRKTIGYATTAEREANPTGFDSIIVRHHGSAIAIIDAFRVEVSNAGHSSRTTAARIHKVLSDNEIPYGFGARDYSHAILPKGSRSKPIPFEGRAEFRMVAGLWELN